MTGRWTQIAVAVATFGLVGGATACGGGDERRGDRATGAPVKVGGIFDLSGATSDVGTPYADGIKGFVRYYNEQGREPSIALTSEDYKYDVAVAKRLYALLKRERVVALQGWGTKDTEELTADVTADRIPFMSASSAETLTDPSKTPFNFVAVSDLFRPDAHRLALDQGADERHRGRVLPSGLRVRRVPASRTAKRTAKQLGLGFKA